MVFVDGVFTWLSVICLVGLEIGGLGGLEISGLGSTMVLVLES